MKETIFVIEDDATVLYGLQAKFQSESFLVETDNAASDMETLMNKLRHRRYDYLILDLILPGMDGFSLLNSIRSDEHLPRVPIFIFTNYADQESKRKCEALGADYYFIKSEFNIDEFAQKAIKIIQNLQKRKN